jgi:hypothetical protein
MLQKSFGRLMKTNMADQGSDNPQYCFRNEEERQHDEKAEKAHP